MYQAKIQGSPDVRKTGKSSWRFGVYVRRPGDEYFAPIPPKAVRDVVITYDLRTTAITGKILLDNDGNKIAEMLPLLGNEQWHIKILPHEMDLLASKYAGPIENVTIEHTFDTVNMMIPELEGIGVGHSHIDIDLVDVETNILKQTGSVTKFIPHGTRISDWVRQQIEIALGPNYINEERWRGSETKLDYPKQIHWNLFDVIHELKHMMYSSDDNMYFLFRDRKGLFCLDTLNGIMKSPYGFNAIRYRDNVYTSPADGDILNNNSVLTSTIDTIDLPDIEEGLHNYDIKSFNPMAKRFKRDYLTVKDHIEKTKSSIGPGPSLIHKEFCKETNNKNKLVPWKSKTSDRVVPYRKALFANTTFNVFSITLVTHNGALDRFAGNHVSLTVPEGLLNRRFNQIYSGAYIATSVSHVWTDHSYKNRMIIVKNTSNVSMNRGFYNER